MASESPLIRPVADPHQPAPLPPVEDSAATLRWAVGGFCSLIGSLMLVAPFHLSGPLYQVILVPLMPWVGFLYLGAGLGLVAVEVIRPSRPFVIYAHLFAGLVMLLMTANGIAAEAWVQLPTYGVISIMTILAPWLQRNRDRDHRAVIRDDFGLTMGLTTSLTGLQMLVAPGLYSASFFDLIRPYLAVEGALLALAGVAVLASQLRADFPERLAKLAHLALLVPYLFYLVLVTGRLVLWTGIAYWGGFGALAALLPWVGPRIRRFDPTTLLARLAVTIALVAALPLVLTATAFSRLVAAGSPASEPASLQAAQNVTYGILLASILGSIVVGAYVGRWLASPLSTLARASERFAAADPSAPIPTAGTREMADLAGAFGRMRDQLVLRAVETAANTKRLQLLQYVSEVGLSSLGLEPLLNELLARVRQVLSADTATILLLTEDGQHLSVRASIGLEEDLKGDDLVPLGQGIAGRIAASREPALIVDMSQADVVRHVLTERLSSLMGVPMIVQGRVIGVMHVGTTERRVFTEEDLRLMQLVADRAASALVRAQAEEERDSLLAEVSAVFASLPDPVFVYRADGTALRANPAALAIYGSDPVSVGLEEFVRKVCLRTPDGTPLEATDLPALRPLRERRVVGERLITTNARGEEVVIQASASPLIVNGEAKGTVSLWHDISERERLLSEVESLARVAESNAAQLNATLASAAHGALVHTVEGHMTFMNAEAERILGYSKEIWNSSPEDRIKLMRAMTLTGEPMQQEESPTRRALRGETVRGLRAVVVRGDGSRVTLSINAAPIISESGEVMGTVTTFEDVTAHLQVQEALRDSEERLRIAVEAVNLGTWDLDLRTDVAVRSLRHDQIWGYEEPMPEWGLEIAMRNVVLEDRQQIMDAYVRAMETGVLKHENRVIWPDGTVHWIDVDGRVYRDSEGRPIRVIGVVADVTERKTAEAERERLLGEVQRQVAELDATIDSILDGVVIYDQTGSIARMNRTARRILGYSPEAFPGAIGERISRLRVETPEGEPFPAEEVPAVKALRGVAAPSVVMIWHLPNGETIWVSASAAPITSLEGAFLGAVTTFTDITALHDLQEQRERLLEEVQHRAAELDATISSIGDGVIIYDASGRIVRMNSTALEMYGYSPEELSLPPSERISRRKVETIDGKPFAAQDVPYLRALKGETVRGVLAKIAVPDRRSIWTSNSTAPIFGPDGNITGAVATITDITALHDLQERQADLARMISHDLRSPLTYVQGQAQMLLRGLERGTTDPERLKKSAAAINFGAKRMDAMIQDLVDMTRSESGQLEVELVAVDLDTFAGELMKRLRDVLDTSRIEVRIPSDLPKVQADPHRLERVLTNLLSNAVKYSEAPAPVVLSAGSVGQEVTISVADRGVGIDPEDLPHIFDRFYRVKATSKREGLGLGLYITRMLVEAMGGRIWPESKPGEGSTFSFSLPEVPEE